MRNMEMPATDFEPPGSETEKTGETDTINNHAFLSAIFGSELTDYRPIVVSFADNPANASSKLWFGWPWAGDPESAAKLPACCNNYFSLAVFRPDESGRYRRLPTARLGARGSAGAGPICFGGPDHSACLD
jgi:hypothetical protein